MTLAHEVSDDLAASLGQRIQPTFGYYRQPNGWITVSPITRLEKLKYVEQGWTCLDSYGAFDMTAYTANHPFEGLFMFGGAKEMSVEQVLQTGLYIDPPLVPRCRQHLTQFHRAHRAACWRGAIPVEFPQLADVPKELIGPFVCDFCQRKMPTKEARQQHQSVAHEKPLGDIQTGSSLGKALADALNNRAGDNGTEDKLLRRIADLEAKLVAPGSLPARDMKGRVACECGATPKVRGQKMHERTPRHQEWAASHRPAAA